MSPGTYLRKRREAAGVSLDLAAVAFVPWPDPPNDASFIALASAAAKSVAVRVLSGVNLLELVRTAAGLIAELEADQRVVDRSITRCLANIVPLDVEIYDALVALHLGVHVPLPQICRHCGCSWHRPCIDRVESGIPGCFAEHSCSWSETDPDLCTVCERKAAAQPKEPADAS